MPVQRNHTVSLDFSKLARNRELLKGEPGMRNSDPRCRHSAMLNYLSLLLHSHLGSQFNSLSSSHSGYGMSPTQLEFLQIFGHSRSPSIEFRELTKKDAKVSEAYMIRDRTQTKTMRFLQCSLLSCSVFYSH